MSQNQAIVVVKPGEATKQSVPVPKLRDDYILVRTKAVALNPTDWKHVAFLTTAGARVGCDYAGIVEEVGSKVTNGLKKGDRVAGFAHGGNEVNHDDGAFGETITAKGDLQIKIPENISFEEAATLGVGISTVGQSLYQSLELPLPTEPAKESFPVLVYGGSTATGSLAIQYLKLSGLQVIATASPHNFDYLKSLGADKVFDYNSPTCAADIRKYTNGKLKHALDCISEGKSPQITVEAMSGEGGLYTNLLNLGQDKIAEFNNAVEARSTLAYTILGEAFAFGPAQFPAKPEDEKFAKMFWAMARDLLEQGKIKVHKPSVNKYGQGLDGVLLGMDAMKNGKVSGEKLVYTL